MGLPAARKERALSTLWLAHQIGVVVFLAVVLLIAVSNLGAVRRLGADPPPAHGPRLSVLVPARDEEANIGSCVRSLLAQNYPDFEVVVLDDHSTDGTGAALAALAAEDGRLRVLAGRDLPDGWLGKHWACQQLAAAADGELLLFTDADTRHDPRTLRAAVAALTAARADLLTALPRQEVVTWGEKLLVPVFQWAFVSFFPFALAYRWRAPALTATVGQFMLFRRAAYEAIGGHAAVRQDPVDDMALGRRVRAAGLGWRLADATGHVHCRMYHGFRQTLDGFSKNLFAAFGNRLLPFLFVWLWNGLVFWQPLVILVLRAAGAPVAGLSVGLATAAVVEALVLWGLAYGRLRLPLYLVLFYPLSTLLFVGVALRSLVLTLTGRLAWKGRPLASRRVRWL